MPKKVTEKILRPEEKAAHLTETPNILKSPQNVAVDIDVTQDQEEIDFERTCPRSIYLMMTLLNQIISAEYADIIDPESSSMGVVVGKKGFSLTFTAPTEAEDPDLRTYCPDTHEGVVHFLSEFQAHLDPNVTIDIDTCTITSIGKLPFFRTLKHFLMSPEVAIGSLDTRVVSINTAPNQAQQTESPDYCFEDPAHEAIVKKQIAKEAEEASVDNFYMRAFDMAKNPDTQAKALWNMPCLPMAPKIGLVTAFFITATSPIQVSLDHILKTIMQEDGLNPKTITPHLIHGSRCAAGYH